MNAQERSEMFDRALKLNAVDRAELRAVKLFNGFLDSRYAPPVIVVAGVAAIDTALRAIDTLIP